MKKLLLTIIFVIFSSNVSAQDFNKGLEAAEAGDFATAMKEWKPLAEQGNAKAQAIIGILYENGHGVLKDYAEAVKWYRSSAEQGHTSAQNNLGYIYDNGVGVLKDASEAVKWYRLSAEQGNSLGQFNLGLSYNNGDGVLQDYVKAHMWYNIASANGHENAGGLRNKLEALMTASDVLKATAMAKECMASDYNKDGRECHWNVDWNECPLSKKNC